MIKLYCDKFYITIGCLTLYALTERIINEWVSEFRMPKSKESVIKTHLLWYV